VGVSLDLSAASRQIRTQGGGISGAAAVLRQEMTALEGALRTADLTVGGWPAPDDIAVIPRALALTVFRPGAMILPLGCAPTFGCGLTKVAVYARMAR
jgi:hypothetical protein